MRSKQEEALLRRARKLVDLGDQLSIREELERVAFDIYAEVGEAVRLRNERVSLAAAGRVQADEDDDDIPAAHSCS